MPLVSVIIPTYQRADVIAETLRSALGQTHRELEVLVEDDGSTDGTEAVVRGFDDPRLSYVRSPNSGRPAVARNRGLARAKGDLVAFLDSDDLWHPEKLARQVAALAADASLSAVATNATTLPDRGRPFLALAADVRPSFDELVRDNVVCCSGVVIRRAVLDRVGGFDEEPTLRAVEDYDLWLRLLRDRDRSILVLKEPLFTYRLSCDSISAADQRRDMERRRRVFAKHHDFRGDVINAIVKAREYHLRKGEILDEFRAGKLSFSGLFRHPELTLSKKLRVAARALVRGRARV